MPVAGRQPIIGPSRPAEISDKDHTIMRQIDRHYLARPPVTARAGWRHGWRPSAKSLTANGSGV